MGVTNQQQINLKLGNLLLSHFFSPKEENNLVGTIQIFDSLITHIPRKTANRASTIFNPHFLRWTKHAVRRRQVSRSTNPSTWTWTSLAAALTPTTGRRWWRWTWHWSRWRGAMGPRGLAKGRQGGLPSGFHSDQTWENLYLYRKSARKSPWNGAQRVQRTDWFRRHRHYVARWWLVKGIIPKSMKNSNFFSLSNPLPPQSSIPTRKLGPFHFLEEKKRYINRWVIPESSLKSSSHIPAVFFQ